MQKTLLEQIKAIDIKEIENNNRINNIFQWAWMIQILIPKWMARKLKITKSYEWWLLTSVSSNWSLETLEDIVNKIVRSYNAFNDINVRAKTILL